MINFIIKFKNYKNILFHNMQTNSKKSKTSKSGATGTSKTAGSGNAPAQAKPSQSTKNTKEGFQKKLL